MTQVEQVQSPQPTVAGVRLRSFAGPSDYAGMAAANQLARDAAGIEQVVTAEGMARDYAHLVNCDLDRDLLIAEHEDGIAGYVRTEWRDLEDGTRSFTSIALLAPDHARRDLFDALLDWAERRSIEKAADIAETDRRPAVMRTFSFGREVHLAAVLEERGWTQTGHGYEMVRPTLDDIIEPPMPEGLVVRPITSDLGLRRQVWDAGSDAFRDERDEPVPTEEDWLATLEDPLDDPTLWLIAFDGDEIAGGVHGRIDPVENAHHGRERGYVEAVYTRRPWRRRGLARALIARCLIRLRERGMSSAYLGVDGLNPNQATDLYTGLGFVPTSTSYDWTKPMPSVEGRGTVPDPGPLP